MNDPGWPTASAYFTMLSVNGKIALAVFGSRMLIESFLAVLALTVILVVVLAGIAKLLFGE